MIQLQTISKNHMSLECHFGHRKLISVKELIIREGGLGTRAVLMSEYTTRTFDCVTDGKFKYECYGFMGKPFAAPTQLNIKDTKEGAIVVSTTLNLGFLKDYASDQYEAINTGTRRFSIDTYTIQS